jgi:glycosyltransferase involved in cell wall biosynthesis
MLEETDRPIKAVAGKTFASLHRRWKDRQTSPGERRLAAYWRYSPLLASFAEHTRDLDPEALWIANDWQVLPIAAEAAARGGVLAYDSHELATEQFAEHADWVRFTKPVIEEVERQYLPEAAIVSTVSDGIADVLLQKFGLPSRPLVVPNVPVYRETQFSKTGHSIRVLYHGVLNPGRGLEEAIKSVTNWPARFSLHLRGPFQSELYKEQLHALTRSYGVADRVKFLPPVPTAELVAAARPYDIGLMNLPALSEHKQFALPNKVFEYMMAGLALLVTDLPEMGRLLRETEAGFLLDGAGAGRLARRIESLDDQQIDQAKKAALRAARRYCWEEQSDAILKRYRQLLS